MLVERSFFLLFGILKAHLVVLDEFRLENASLIFDSQTNVAAEEVKRVELEVGVNHAWVPEDPIDFIGHENFTILLFEALVVGESLFLARTRFSFLDIGVNNS